MATKQKRQKRTDRWFPAAVLAQVLGISPQHLRTNLLPAIPEDSVDRHQKPMLIYGPALVQLVVDRAKESVERRHDDAESVASATSCPHLAEKAPRPGEASGDAWA